MHTFSRLSLLTLLLLGFALIFTQSAVLAQEGSLEVAGGDGEYRIGDTVTATFFAPPNTQLLIDAQNVTITGIGFANGLKPPTAGIPGNYTTAPKAGYLTVQGTIQGSPAFISAFWDRSVEDDILTRLYFNLLAPYSLEALADGAEVAVGDTVEVIFVAEIDNLLASGVQLTIASSGISDVVVSNDGITDVLGRVTVTGTIVQAEDVHISARWVERDLDARAEFHVPHSAALIVVNSPDPKSPLAVGNVFEQVIEIQDAIDLASWQMDIAFNPEVLEVVDISEGDFLEQDDGEPLFLSEQHPGKIAIRQARVGEIGAPMSGVSGSGVLVVLSFKFVSSSEALLGLHNVRLSDSSGERLSYSVTLTPVVATHASDAAEDVNQDGQVDILDMITVAGSIGAAKPNLRADVNDDGIIDVLDLVAIAGSPHWGRSVNIVQVRESNAAAPAASVSYLMPKTIREWIALAQIKNDGSLRFQRGIANLESLLAARLPSETRLLRNYPNPFNPETWIPYQLSEASDVTVSIYAVDGSLIRTLALGHQPAGLYQRKSRAAYWDGRNEFGEPVASGLYFYTLTAGDFTATRKMLIQK